MTRKQKKLLKRIIIALVLFLITLVSDLILKNVFSSNFPNGLASIINSNLGWLLPFGIYFLIYVFIGYDILKKSFINICHGQVLDENFLMAFATIAAFALGIYSGLRFNDPEGFDEACAVLLFFQVGEWFESYAAGRSRKSIKELMDIKPDNANLYKDGEFVLVDPLTVNVSDIILVKPGERIPLDGIIVKGETSLDTKDLTGESLPRDVKVGDNVISGTINLISSIEVKTTKTYSDSTVSKILDLVENASSNKSKSEAFITKFAKYYTPIVVILAVLVAIIPPLVYTINGNPNMWTLWIYRALSFLVVSCPCALVISVPMSFFAGLGGAAKRGILIKGSIHLERFNQVNTFVFDKTGTLTKGNFKVTKIYPENKKEEILYNAAIAERDSIHPIALSIKELYGNDIVSDYMIKNEAGKGIVATNGSNTILVGNSILMDENNIKYEASNDIGSICYVAKNNEFLGYIVISDEIKDNAYEAISMLNSMGVSTIMLSGDNDMVAKSVSEKLGLTSYKANLLPQDKVSELENIKKEANGLVSYAGDGINDAPSIMASDIGIAMGGVGAVASIEAADIVLMQDDLKQIFVAKKIAKKTLRIVKENIVFAITIKILILVLSVLGITNMWYAVFGDVGVAVLCILNAFRLNIKKN